MANALSRHSPHSYAHSLFTGKNVKNKHSKYTLIEKRGAKTYM